MSEDEQKIFIDSLQRIKNELAKPNDDREGKGNTYETGQLRSYSVINRAIRRKVVFMQKT